jgi:CheY-like chemotaxis protein
MEKLLLADDDMDDRLFFQDAVEDLFSTTTLSTVSDGVELMEFLTKNIDQLPDVLFLDLNMPRKSGSECLLEIKSTESLKFLPVVIFSTSMDIDMVNKLYEMGANYYIRKPGDFSKLKKAINQATVLLTVDKINQPERSKFIIQC